MESTALECQMKLPHNVNCHLV